MYSLLTSDSTGLLICGSNKYWRSTHHPDIFCKKVGECSIPSIMLFFFGHVNLHIFNLSWITSHFYCSCYAMNGKINPFLGIGMFMHIFDTLVVCCTFCTLLILNVVWSLIRGLHSYGPFEGVNLFVEKQVILPAALPGIESEILGCKNEGLRTRVV